MSSSLDLASYLPYVANIARNPVRSRPSETGLFTVPENCEVCTTPTDGWARCYQCNQHKATHQDELADLVVPLSYGIKGHTTLGQYYADLQNYKNGQNPSAARNRLKIMAAFYEGIHGLCATRVLGPVGARTIVPSGRARQPPHPLEEIVAYIQPDAPLIQAVFVGTARTGRATGLNPDDFAFPQGLTGHMLIVEDAWVQGNNAQALAIAARRAGADVVSIVVLGRVLDAGWHQSAGWITAHLEGAQWDPQLCPVTGATCP